MLAHPERSTRCQMTALRPHEQGSIGQEGIQEGMVFRFRHVANRAKRPSDGPTVLGERKRYLILRDIAACLD